MKKKLQVKPGMAMAVVNARPGYPLPEDTEHSDGHPDAIVLFAEDRAQLDASLDELDHVKPGGLIWVAYRKGGVKAGTDLNRDLLHQHLESKGLIGVSLVALDATWSAMRFKRA